MSEIVYEPDQRRFATHADSGTARLDVIESKDLLVLAHTEVPAPMEGQGFGSGLVHAALDYARTQGLRVMPLCPFAAAYMRRHPETQDLLMRGVSI